MSSSPCLPLQADRPRTKPELRPRPGVRIEARAVRGGEPSSVVGSFTTGLGFAVVRGPQQAQAAVSGLSSTFGKSISVRAMLLK